VESGHFQIYRFRVQYLVPAQHPAPERAKDRLDSAVTQQLAPMLSSVFSAWFSDSDPGIWCVRRLEVELAVNAAWEREQLSRAMTTQIARILGATLQAGGAQDNVRHFPNRATYLASFLSDLAAGVAWSQWYYESFAGLRLLPTSAALRTAICDEFQTGSEALAQLANDDIKRVVRTLTEQDARRTLETLTAQAPPSDNFRCCQVVWEAWQGRTTGDFSVNGEWRLALFLYLTVVREQHEVGGVNVQRAALALVRLARRLADASASRYQQFANALTGGELSFLYMAAGAGDAEALLPLFHCPPAWTREVAAALFTQRTGQATREIVTMPDRRDTAFGGVFLLLPILDNFPLAEAIRDWPHTDEAAAISLVRFLLLIKCCGQDWAQRVFYDPVLRDLLLIPPSISHDVLHAWENQLTPTHLRTFLDVLVDWQISQGAVGEEQQVLAVTFLRRRPQAVLIDAARGLWMLLQQQSVRRPHAVPTMLLERLGQLERNDGLLVCDAALFPFLRAQCPTLKLVNAVAYDSTAVPDDETKLREVLVRLDRLPDELAHLALPASFGLSRSFDLTLSIAAQHLLRAFAWRLPGFARSHLPYLYANFLAGAGSLEEESSRRVVRLSRPPLHLVLNMTGMLRNRYQVSWLDERPFVLFPEE
jgi:hypothetical protein